MNYDQHKPGDLCVVARRDLVDGYYKVHIQRGDLYNSLVIYLCTVVSQSSAWQKCYVYDLTTLRVVIHFRRVVHSIHRVIIN
jgi:hypothetical protein